MAMVPPPAPANENTPVNEYEPLNPPLLKKLTCAPPSRYFLASSTDSTTFPPMVKIFVGPDRKLWVLPEQLLCDRVEYFKSAFQSGFQESNEKFLELPEDCPVAFAYIIDRILGDPQLPTKNSGEGHMLDRWRGVSCTCWQIDLHVLAW